MIVSIFAEDRQDAQGEQTLLESWGRFASLAVERRGLYEQLSFRAQYDSLTALLNRAALYDRVDSWTRANAAKPIPMALVYLDLDGFKQINDTFGHAAGDELLQMLATRLRSVLRASDTAARLSGDEFVVLIEGGTDEHMSEVVAHRLLRALREPYDLAAAGGRPVTVTATIGIATQLRDTVDQLLHDADIALYTAKRSGRDQCAFFTPSMKMELTGSDRRRHGLEGVAAT
jgi:diguanylate cyclase (GGDEF)-like protein